MSDETPLNNHPPVEPSASPQPTPISDGLKAMSKPELREPPVEEVDAPFDLSDYHEATEPIVFKLQGKRKLKAQLFINFQNQTNLDAFDRMTAEMAESQSLNDLHKAYATNLATALASIDAVVVVDGKKVKLDSADFAKRFEFIRALSFQDLKLMQVQIGDALNRPLDGDETAS